jgi:hypothetical protein
LLAAEEIPDGGDNLPREAGIRESLPHDDPALPTAICPGDHLVQRILLRLLTRQYDVPA